MRNRIKIFYALCLLCSPLSAQPITVSLKETIRQLETELSLADVSNKSGLLLQLAKIHYQDQDQEKAFTAYLEALNTAMTRVEPLTTEDTRLYNEALAVYLDSHAQSTRATAAAVLDKYEPIVTAHPDYFQLSFLVAAGYANTGKLPEFFEMFYRAYEIQPDHYMAHKTRAIIHIKLLERASTLQEKKRQKNLILIELEKAAHIYPADHALYKMIVAFSPEDQKVINLNASLKKIIDRNMVIPRTDIGFYIEEAVKMQQFELAQSLLDKAKEWYRFSRIINTAQEFLDQHKTRG